jgi:hypothetical protein
MSDTPNRKQPADEWTALIKSYLESGLTQKAFCEQQGISFHGFRYHYQRSPLFRGKRRRPRGDGFQRVIVTKAASRVAQTWTVRCGERVRIDCPADTPVEAIVRLARGLADAT